MTSGLRTFVYNEVSRQFTGEERDPESGTDYFNARQYAYTLGRFLQPDEFQGGPVDVFSSNDPLPPGPLPYADIVNPQSLNKYTYTYNNPLRYTDPSGHDVLNYEVTPEGLKVTSPGESLSFPDIDIDQVQSALDAAGFIPGAGVVADIFNSVISGVRGNLGEAAINLAAAIPAFGDALKGAKMTSRVFANALEGGKHAGFLKNYAGRSVREIDKGIKSLGKQIATHENKIKNPAKYEKNWDKLSKKEKEGLLKKWEKDMQRQKEQKEVLEKLKEVKQAVKKGA